jgi:hypothetical protein
MHTTTSISDVNENARCSKMGCNVNININNPHLRGINVHVILYRCKSSCPCAGGIPHQEVAHEVCGYSRTKKLAPLAAYRVYAETIF